MAKAESEHSVWTLLKALGVDSSPSLIVIAGPNGAGKTTFYHSHLRQASLRYVNADLLARELGIDSYEAAEVVSALREELLKQKESFIFETVFSDPVRAKLEFLKHAIKSGYNVALCFIGLTDASTSEERVLMRVSQGGHDVPTEKIAARFPRVLANLASAVRELPAVLAFDNSDLDHPFRLVAVFRNGEATMVRPPVPPWLGPLVMPH